MSVRAITQVLAASRHSGTELLMLVVLADYSDDDGYSYPAVASLALKCRMSSRNANYILGALQVSGELRVLKNQGPKDTNRYRIMFANLGHEPLKAVASLKPTSPLKLASPTPPEAACTPEEGFTLKPTSATPEAGFPKPLKPTSDEPSLNRQEPSEKSARAARLPAAERGSRLAAEWTLPGEWRTWALGMRPELDPDAMAERFADHWRGKAGKDGRKADWLAIQSARICRKSSRRNSWRRRGGRGKVERGVGEDRYGNGAHCPLVSVVMGCVIDIGEPTGR